MNSTFRKTSVFPGSSWETKSAGEMGLDESILSTIRDRVGGNGVVIRDGYLVYDWGSPNSSRDIASAGKTVISALLMIAIQNGRIESPDSLVADFEPRLLESKNATMT